MHRRDVLKAIGGTALGSVALAAPRLARAAGERTLTFVPTSDLPVLDPVFTSARPTRNHAYLVFDTLYGLDAAFAARPQMLAGHQIENDGLVWTLTLRDGLRFHDGEKVLTRDAVASIRRFAERNGFAAALMDATAELSAPTDATIRFRLRRPFPHLPDALAGVSGNVPAIMPERLATTPGSKQVTEMIGSGPYRFLPGERLSGARVVYERFAAYVSRQDGALGYTAGPKVAYFDRVQWLTMPDAATTAAALRTGEIDWWELPPWDLVPQLARDRNVRVQAEYGTAIGVLRFNHLHPPFDNPGVRRAVLGAIDQAEAMTAIAGTDKAHWHDGVGLFGVEAPLANDAGNEVVARPDPARARDALKAAGYGGEKIVVIAPTDIADMHALSVVGAEQLRRAGMRIDLQEMDFGSVVRRRMSKATPDQGGWNAFFTLTDGAYNINPYGNTMIRADGAAAFDGWPTSPCIESLRTAWLDAADLAAERRVCRELQMQLWQDVPYAPMGEYFQPTAFRRDLADLPQRFPQFYGVRRT